MILPREGKISDSRRGPPLRIYGQAEQDNDPDVDLHRNQFWFGKICIPS
jgi:hypothetical protein